MPPSFPVLATDRLVLREIVLDDAPALFEIHGDAELMRWFGSDPLPNIEAAVGLVNVFSGWRSLPNPGVRWALQYKDETSLVGTCGLFAWERNWQKCTLGYELHPAAHGKGLMREALVAALNWGFLQMGLNRVEAQIHPSNGASLKEARHLGFSDEGRLREVRHWGGKFHDLLQFSLLRREWEARHAAC